METQQLYDKIEDLEDENTILKEVRDELMEENEKLRKEIHKLSKVKEGGELIGNRNNENSRS